LGALAGIKSKKSLQQISDCLARAAGRVKIFIFPFWGRVTRMTPGTGKDVPPLFKANCTITIGVHSFEEGVSDADEQSLFNISRLRTICCSARSSRHDLDRVSEADDTKHREVRTKGGLQFVLCELVVMVAVDAIEQCEQLLFGFVHEFPEFCGERISQSSD
jgi:hypothetical protein